MPLHPQSKQILDRLLTWRCAADTTVTEARQASVELTAEFVSPAPRVSDVTSIAIPGPYGPVQIQVYRPSSSVALGILIYFHGGGFVVGSLEQADPLCRTIALTSQCIVVSVGYRLAPEFPFPAGVEDCYAAVTWVESHREQIGALGAPIAVAGESAGGCLAASVTLIARDRGGPQIDFQLLIYPMTSCRPPDVTVWPDGVPGFPSPDAIKWLCDRYVDPSSLEDPLASPLLAPSLVDLPPAMIITAEYDTLRQQGEMYAARLIDAGVPVISRRYEGMLHGFLEYGGMDGLTDQVADCISYLGFEVGQALERTIRQHPVAVYSS